jgi:GLPGLI family protein
MKKRAVYLFLTIQLSMLALRAQNTQGVVHYERRTDYGKLIAQLSYLSQEEKDRVKLTWGADEPFKEKLKLYFSSQASLFTHSDEQGQTEDGNWSWRQRDYIITRNFEKESKAELMETMGKTYLVEDSLQTYNWRILNQIKDVAGYVCMKAVTEDTIKKQKITVWFAQDLPVGAGPELLHGLPGVILEMDINDGVVIVEATKIELKDVSKELVAPKMKGKKIKNKDYLAITSKHIKDSMKAQRNPFWTLRY